MLHVGVGGLSVMGSQAMWWGSSSVSTKPHWAEQVRVAHILSAACRAGLLVLQSFDESDGAVWLVLGLQLAVEFGLVVDPGGGGGPAAEDAREAAAREDCAELWAVCEPSAVQFARGVIARKIRGQ